MRSRFEHYQYIAELFKYPVIGFKEKAVLLKNKIGLDFPDMILQIRTFVELIDNLTISNLEEHYVNTFLINPVSSLDIGFILFGDDSKRNEFLVNIQHEQKKVDNECYNELADHLPNILTLIPKIEDRVFVDELVYSLLIPSIKEIKSKFDLTENLYKHAFDLLLAFFNTDFGFCEFEQFEINKKESTKAGFCNV